MEPGVRDELKAAFDSAATSYRQGRPGYPPDAVRWLLGDVVAEPSKLDVLDLGAGTGALTEQIVATGACVVAAEPSHQMLASWPSRQSARTAVQAYAEQLPFRARLFDVVTIAQAFHWLDHEDALPEIARVLRAGGSVAVVYNTRDESAPWARRFGEILTAAQPTGLEGDWGSGSVGRLAESSSFGMVTTARFGFTHVVTREELVALASSRSYVIAATDARRSAVLAAVGDLFDETVRTTDDDTLHGAEPRLRLTYVTDCWRAQVAPRR